MLLVKSRAILSASARQILISQTKASFATSKLLSSADPSIDSRILEVGPWPKTQAERLAAARKYNLIPEDYQPYPEGEGFGDYPHLALIGNINRDQYDDYDDFTDHRFYGEPYHRDADVVYHERLNPKFYDDPPVSFFKMFIVIVGMVTSACTAVLVPQHYQLHFNLPYKMEPSYEEKRSNLVMYDFPEPSSHHGHHH